MKTAWNKNNIFHPTWYVSVCPFLCVKKKLYVQHIDGGTFTAFAFFPHVSVQIVISNLQIHKN